MVRIRGGHQSSKSLFIRCFPWEALQFDRLKTQNLQKFGSVKLLEPHNCQIWDSASWKGDPFTWRPILNVKKIWKVVRLMEEIRRSPVEVGSLSCYLYRVFLTCQLVVWDFFHQQYDGLQRCQKILARFLGAFWLPLFHRTRSWFGWRMPLRRKVQRGFAGWFWVVEGWW